MRVAVTGGTGFAGRFITEALIAADDDVTVLSRRTPSPALFTRWVRHVAHDLGRTPPPLDGFDAVIHAAFDHVPGRYRGGEGDDPDGFLRRNLDGSVALFEAARAAGVACVAFLSSRAVYGDYPPGTRLTEDLPPRPDTLYGRAKHDAERVLAELSGRDFRGVSLRATGLYGPAGPGRRHKWSDLFESFQRGDPIAPRVGTEVHGDDLATAIRQHIFPSGQGGVFNVSDLALDRRDLLTEVAALTGWPGRIPPAACTEVSAMTTERLTRLGWRPGGWERLRAALPELVVAAVEPRSGRPTVTPPRR